MATTGNINGTNILIYVNGTAIGCATSGSISMNTSTIDVTCKDSSGWTEILAGLRDWSLDGEGLTQFDATYGFNDLVSVWKNRTKVTVRFSTNVTGDEYFEGQAYLTALSEDAPNEDVTTYSYTFSGTGELNTPTYT